MDIETAYDHIYRFVYYRVHDHSITEDITQETFLRFIQKYGYKTHWNMKILYTIARNLCIDTYRYQRREDSFQEGDGVQPSHENKVMEQIQFEHALDKLTQKEREILLLRYVNEEPIGTLSQLYGCSRFVIYRIIQKAFKKIKEDMEEGYDE
jgi:RNA polymerase sigma-70 factor (ECF subfamily)